MGLYRWCLIFSLMVFSGVNYAACFSTGPVISGHFDNAFIGYDGKTHISDAGCDYVSISPIVPTVTVIPDVPDGFSGGMAAEGDFQPTGKTSEEFKKFNDAYIQAQEEYDKTHPSPDICKIDGCDILGNPLSQEETGKSDIKMKTLLDPVFPRYDPAKSYSTNAANFTEANRKFKDVKFSTLSNSYKYRDDMVSFHSSLNSFINQTYPLYDLGWMSHFSDPKWVFKHNHNQQMKAPRELLLSQKNLSILPEIVRDNFWKDPFNRSPLFNEYFQTIVDPLAVLSGSGNNESGQPGNDGVNGADGKDGRDGINGANGKDGINGIDGKDGEKGDKGDKGEGVDNDELARFHHDSVVASGNIIGLLGRIHDAVVSSGGSGGSGVSPGGVPDTDDGSVTHPLGPSVSDGEVSSGAAGDDEDVSNIFLPSLDIPELSLSPLWNMWPSARDFTLNLPDAQCPVFTIEVFGLNQRIDTFCTLLTPDVIAVLRLICILTASVFSFIIVLRS